MDNNLRDISAHTAIRGLACLLVFFAHTEFFRFFPNSQVVQWLARPFVWTSQAVDIFFMLSGFILYYVYGQFPPAWKKYMWARFSRIYPVYFITTSFFLGFVLVQYAANHVISDKFSISQLASNLLLIQSWPWPWPADSLNYPAWSISIEALLYIFVFPLLYWGCRRISFLRNAAPAGLIAGIVLSTAALWLTYHELDKLLPPDGKEYGYVFDSLRGIFGFTAGYLIAMLAVRLEFRTSISAPIEAACLLLFIGSLIFRWPGASELILPLSPILIYCGATASSLTTRLLSNRPLLYFGELSYSLYLWHAPVMAVLSRLFHIRGEQGGELNVPAYPAIGIAYLATTVVLTFAAAHVSYFYFEIPVKRMLRGALRNGLRNAFANNLI